MSGRADPSPPPARMRRSGFTLLELMLGVMVIALVTLTIFRFLETHLRAIAISGETSSRQLAIEGFLAVLGSELAAIPAVKQNALYGEPHLFGKLPSDEIAWLSGPGNGLFTRHAPGEFRALLALRKSEDGKGTVLGIDRTPPDEPNAKSSWLPLLPEIAGVEFRYFDPRLNGWADKWQDGRARPSLVRIRLWTDPDAPPHEAVFPLPTASALQGGIPLGPGTEGQGGDGNDGETPDPNRPNPNVRIPAGPIPAP